ncbi:Uncharacterised protein [Mycobacteroides abscessus subsp. abscessus]|nr:Uncharacterised protein [Mycobacteroides abscessus subsp. abscessus]
MLHRRVERRPDQVRATGRHRGQSGTDAECELHVRRRGVPEPAISPQGRDPKVDGHAPFAVTNTGNVPFVPNTELRVTVPTIFQYLFGDSYEQEDGK